MKSGYGAFRDLYTLSNLTQNVRLYPQWLWETHGAFVFAGLMSPLVWIYRRHAVLPKTSRLITFSLVFTTVLYAGYVCYLVFDNWTFTRFLLPGIPLLLLLSVWTISAAVRSFGSDTANTYVMVGFAFVVLGFIRNVEDRDLFSVRRGERRNIEAARYIAATSPPDVLVLSVQHSGSVRYYGGLKTVRYDWLDPHGLDSAILTIQQMHRGPLLMLDDWEEPQFRRRFQGQKWGALDWPPRVEFESLPRARLYDPSDRDRYIAHQHVATIRLPVK
jgi:hypothetical protein